MQDNIIDDCPVIFGDLQTPISVNTKPKGEEELLNKGAERVLLTDIDNIDDSVLNRAVDATYEYMLRDIYVNKRAKYVYTVAHKRFLTSLTNLFRNNRDRITDEIKVQCNELAYDYFTALSIKREEDLKMLFLDFVKVVSRDTIAKIRMAGVSESNAVIFAMAFNSSTNTEIKVKRLNTAIIRAGVELADANVIINLYEQIFDELKGLFIYTMIDKIDKESLSNTGPYANEIYSNIGLVVVTMLEAQTLQLIREILISYADTCESREVESRFSMGSLFHDDYRNIYYVVDELESDGYCIP